MSATCGMVVDALDTVLRCALLPGHTGDHFEPGGVRWHYPDGYDGFPADPPPSGRGSQLVASAVTPPRPVAPPSPAEMLAAAEARGRQWAIETLRAEAAKIMEENELYSTPVNRQKIAAWLTSDALECAADLLESIGGPEPVAYAGDALFRATDSSFRPGSTGGQTCGCGRTVGGQSSPDAPVFEAALNRIQFTGGQP